jgi:hypothetical protein
MTMSPVADTEIVSPATFAAGSDSRIGDRAGPGRAVAGASHLAEAASEPRFAKATLPAPTATNTARTMVIVRTGGPKMPGLRGEGWEFIDRDDTFGERRGRPVERLVVADHKRRKTPPVTAATVTLRHLDQGVPARFPPACA